MRYDNDILKDVQLELAWDPRLSHQDIAVAVRDGVATLAGYCEAYADKLAAERLVGRIKDVRAVANDIEVRLPALAQRSDPEIARAALLAFQWHTAVPEKAVKLKVENGWVKLEGEVDWYFQKEAAEKAVKHLMGVKGVTNLITIKARATTGNVKDKIKSAFQRAAAFDADRIAIEVADHTVTLRGTVRSWAEKQDAERAARNAPGVTAVDNNLAVDSAIFAGV